MTMDSRQTFFIETFGCQMNDRDSEIMAQMLEQSYSPALSVDDADLVVVNTCSIRAKAEQKALSLLGRLRRSKNSHRGKIIAVVGCVAQQEGERLLERLPHVDLVVGTQNIYNLPALIEEVSAAGRRVAAVEQSASFAIPPFLPAADKGLGFKRYVTIMQGCDNFCTYCVVPYTRGREVSRPREDILAEVRHLTANGVREITLLGQNVNSYGRGMGGRSHGFAGLLREVASVDGLRRLRFTTSNPHDLTAEVIGCFAELDVLCPHFHLPVQSGSNAVLKAMNRRYTREKYLDLVAALRRARPGIAITTDIIVGFPGESEEDFRMTMDLVREVRFHGAFSFRYSDRPRARSAGFPLKLPEAVKQERLAALQELINSIAEERLADFVGSVQDVMVEGRSRNNPREWSGRTGHNIIVNFAGPDGLSPGDTLPVVISGACRHSLRGEAAPAEAGQGEPHD